jgi:hypothetical protein
MPWRRSATRTLWDDSYTFAKIARPSLVSATQLPHAEVSKAAPACVEVEHSNNKASVVPLVELPVEVAGRFTLPTFVARFFPCSIARGDY